MASSAKTAGFFCPNSACSDYGKRGTGNIVVYNRYGRNNRRLLRCKTCNLRFSERRNTFFFGLHTQESKIKEVILCLLDGKSFREAATTAGIDKDTVLRIWRRFVASCEESMEDLLTEFNINLEDLITLLYQRKGLSKKRCAPRPSSGKNSNIWERLCRDEGLSAEDRLCGEHE
jgi:transposase-like protein